MKTDVSIKINSLKDKDIALLARIIKTGLRDVENVITNLGRKIDALIFKVGETGI